MQGVGAWGETAPAIIGVLWLTERTLHMLTRHKINECLPKCKCFVEIFYIKCIYFLYILCKGLASVVFSGVGGDLGWVLCYLGVRWWVLEPSAAM